MHLDDKEAFIRAKLSDLGFDLKREPGSLDWIVWDRHEGKEFLKAIPAARCRDLEMVMEFFQLEVLNGAGAASPKRAAPALRTSSESPWEQGR
jgi:hypothetical protein